MVHIGPPGLLENLDGLPAKWALEAALSAMWMPKNSQVPGQITGVASLGSLQPEPV